MQLREHGLNMMGKEIEGLMCFQGVEKNEKKRTCTKLDRITIHVSPKKKKDFETNQMTRQKHDYDPQSHLHVLPEGNEATLHVSANLPQLDVLQPWFEKKTFQHSTLHTLILNYFSTLILNSFSITI